MKAKPDKKKLEQLTIDGLFGEMLLGAAVPGGTIPADPQQGDLFRTQPRQLRFETTQEKPCPKPRP